MRVARVLLGIPLPSMLDPKTLCAHNLTLIYLFVVISTHLYCDLYLCSFQSPQEAQTPLITWTLPPIWPLHSSSNPTPHPSLIPKTVSLCYHFKAGLLYAVLLL